MTLLALAALGCGEPSSEQSKVVATSTPVASATDEMHIELKEEVIRPDGRKALTVGTETHLEVPGFDALEGEPRSIALAVANQTTGPCPACMDDGVALSVCECEASEPLLRTIVSMATEGKGFLEIAERVEWEDPWYALPEGLPSRGEGSPVVVVVDYESPFSREAESTWSDLKVQVHLLPWWSKDREIAPLAAAAIASLDDPWELHEAFLTEALTADRVRALAKEHGADLEAGQAEALRRKMLAEQMGVRGAPTVFLDGYRIRGQRPVEFYRERLLALP